jgi:glycosyltransferase involved in cell wall biosynthesis
VIDAAMPSVLHVFPSFAVGGAQVRTAALINHFAGRFRHEIVAMDGNHDCRERISAQADVTYTTLEFRKANTLANVRLFRRLLKEARPNVLVTSNWGSLEWAMANIPRVVRHIHMEDGFGPDERETQVPRRVWTRRLLLRRSDVVVPSRLLQRIAADIWRLPKRRIRYVPNGVDLGLFAPGGLPHSICLAGEGPVIGTVAALRAEKNLVRLLQAFCQVVQVMPARLLIVGDGQQRPMLEALAQEFGIASRVHFTGHMAGTHGAYGNFDLFALSSDTEQMPLSVLEAMAAGLAVAATDVGDIRAMVAPENGGCIVPKDDTALAGAMLELLRDPELRSSIGAANRAKAVREFDQDSMFRTYGRLYAGDDGTD